MSIEKDISDTLQEVKAMRREIAELRSRPARDIITRQEAAQILEVDFGTIGEYVRCGKLIPATKGRPMFNRQDVLNLKKALDFEIKTMDECG